MNKEIKQAIISNFFDTSVYATIVHYKTQINGHWGFKTECYIYDDELRAIEHGQDSIFDHKLIKLAFEFLAETKRYDYASAFIEVVKVSNIDQSELRSKS